MWATHRSVSKQKWNQSLKPGTYTPPKKEGYAAIDSEMSAEIAAWPFLGRGGVV